MLNNASKIERSNFSTDGTTVDKYFDLFHVTGYTRNSGSLNTHSRETRHSQPLAHNAVSRCYGILRFYGTSWNLKMAVAGRPMAAESKRNSISLADRLLLALVLVLFHYIEISIRKHVDIEKTRCSSRYPPDVSIVIADYFERDVSRESINIPETGRSVSFPGDL